jgi:hypothetical protein
MVTVRMSVVVGKDRRLVIELPDDMPLGPADLIIQPKVSEGLSARAKLMAAGVLVNPRELGIPEGIEYVSDEELEELGILPPGARPSEDLIDEDRGER